MLSIKANATIKNFAIETLFLGQNYKESCKHEGSVDIINYFCALFDAVS
jgi:hypothetical protein